MEAEAEAEAEANFYNRLLAHPRGDDLGMTWG